MMPTRFRACWTILPGVGAYSNCSIGPIDIIALIVYLRELKRLQRSIGANRPYRRNNQNDRSILLRYVFPLVAVFVFFVDS
jgi:sorbitol-specific phosphotransferase system component IIC